MRLKVGQAAADDLGDIWRYTVQHWSVEQADRYVNVILDGFELVLRDPGAGKDFGHVREGYRGLKTGSHLVFYRVDVAANVIKIVRVLHGRLDLENRLNP